MRSLLWKYWEAAGTHAGASIEETPVRLSAFVPSVTINGPDTPYGFGVTVSSAFAAEISARDLRLRLPFVGELFSDFRRVHGTWVVWEPWENIR